jgi:hypothetical protein
MENFLQSFNFFFGNHVLHHHAHRGLLEFLYCIERHEIVEALLHDIGVDLGIGRVFEPYVLQ